MQSPSWYKKDQCMQQSKKQAFNSIQTEVYWVDMLICSFLKLVLDGFDNDPPLLAQMLLKTHCQENSEIQESLRLLIQQTFTTKENTNGQQPC